MSNISRRRRHLSLWLWRFVAFNSVLRGRARREQALVTQFGDPVRVIKDPGLGVEDAVRSNR